MQFTKLFSSILDSTIWQEPAETKIVWITMLAMADRHGEVHASVPGLAKRAGVTLAECEAALDCLRSPDDYSRTKEHEGRRIEDIDGGWRLLNHGKYRALLSAEERREYNRRKQAEYRAKKKAEGVNDTSMTVNHSEQSAHSTEAEAEAEIKTPLPPEGDENENRVLPKGWTNWPSQRQKSERVLRNSPLMQRLGRWFGRKPGTLWTVHEAGLLQRLKPAEEEIELLERRYLAVIDKDHDYRRRDLATLLGNWNTELDRARTESA